MQEMRSFQVWKEINALNHTINGIGETTNSTIIQAEQTPTTNKMQWVIKEQIIKQAKWYIQGRQALVSNEARTIDNINLNT